MNISPIFQNNNNQIIQQNVIKFINKQKDFLGGRTVSSTRAVGDAIQSILEESFSDICGSYIKEYTSHFNRRSMADLAFTDKSDFYHSVDIKTHRLDTVFNMPNLTSVERLSRYYEGDDNYFDLLLIAYSVKDLHINVEKVYFVPIEQLSWQCLTIGALGWGQIQIANSNNIILEKSPNRKKWMINLCDTLMDFYPQEINKIGDRVSYFKKVRKYWIGKKS